MNPDKFLISDTLFAKIKGWQEALHKIPEPSWAEHDTKALIRELVPEDPAVSLVFDAEAGLLYKLQKGDGAGKRYVIRADIDGLPIEEESGLPYASERPGFSHTCGHDTHMAMALGAMHALCEHLENGTVYFLFQAAEEIPPSGAKALVDQKLLDPILPVDGILGLHVVPYLPAGTVGLLPVGHGTTANGFFDIHIHGKSTHSSQPHLGIDPLVLGAEIILGANEIIAKELDPREFRILSICEMHGGSVKNQIPERCRLGGSLRVLSQETKEKMVESLRRHLKALADRSGAEIELDYIEGHPSVLNDATLFEKMETVCREILPEDRLVYPPFWQASDDFSHFQKIAPTYYFHLGSAANEEMMRYNNHHPKFAVDQNALRLGAELWVQFILKESQN